MYKLLLLLSLCIAFPNSSFAQEANIGLAVESAMTFLLKPVVDLLAFLFLGSPYEFFGHELKLSILGFPLFVGWLVIGGIFFTLYFKFINIRYFGHAIRVVSGKYDDPDAPGKVSHLQALFVAVSGTVGVGNIAGVAIAITMGGPGAVVWMMIAAFFGMSAKFAEVTLGQKYRILKDGHLFAGPFYYLRDGLADIGKVKLGKILSIVAALCCVAGAIGAGIMIQANQAVSIIIDTMEYGTSGKLLLSIVIAGVIGFVLLGGIVRIAHIASAIVPFMAVFYVVSAIIVLVYNHDNLLNAIQIMFSSAFSDNALYGGVIGAMVQGFRRAAFSNEAGIGSSAIAHAAAKTKEPVREGMVALLEPFIDTIVICFMTGLVIVITGSYVGISPEEGGVLLTRAAFMTVSPMFSTILSIIVFLFAFSTILTYSYYGQQAWTFLRPKGNIRICHIVFMIAVFVGGVTKLSIIIDLADILFLSMAIPNLLGLYMLSGVLKREVNSYLDKLHKGKFDKKIVKDT